MKRVVGCIIILTSAVVVGFAALLIAEALGATHTTCGVGYCDRRGNVWSILALIVGAILGGTLTATLLRHRTSLLGHS
jgi:hypothetical protein